MKIMHFSKDIALTVIILTVLAAMISFSASGQDTVKPKKQARIKIKIVDDKNGKVKNIDTTFTLSGIPDDKEIRAYVKGLRDEMKDMKDEMREMQVYVDIPDSLDKEMDSLNAHVFVFGDRPDMGMNHFRKHFRDYGEGFDFNFDYPLPPCPPDIPDIMDISPFDDGHMRVFRHNDNEQTLGDLIGDIPMSQVKSYSIKETKNGKKIVIELNNEPLIIRKDKDVNMQ